jgi:hypothetical protein
MLQAHMVLQRALATRISPRGREHQVVCHLQFQLNAKLWCTFCSKTWGAHAHLLLKPQRECCVASQPCQVTRQLIQQELLGPCVPLVVDHSLDSRQAKHSSRAAACLQEATSNSSTSGISLMLVKAAVIHA